MAFEIHAVAPRSSGAFRAVLPEDGTDRFDPFLVLHEQGPVRYGPGEAIGFGDHPHRGFETVTYIIEGEQFHRDSRGHEGVIAAGGLQWMTAASGIVHAELPTQRVKIEGGRMHAFQIWLDVPDDRKTGMPRYQEFERKKLPVVSSSGAWVRVLAGSYRGVASPVEAAIPTTIAHVRLEPRADAAFEVADGSTTIVYAMTGDANLGAQHLPAGNVATSRTRRSHVALGAGPDGFEALVMTARPIRGIR